MKTTLTLTLNLRATGRGASQLSDNLALQADIDLHQLARLLQQALAETAGPAAASGRLLDFVRRHNADYARRVGNGQSLSSLRKYEALARHLEDYLRREARADCPLAEVDAAFVRGFTVYLREHRDQAAGTVRLYLVALRGIVRQAWRQGLLTVDPFTAVDLPAASYRRNSLTKDEIALLAACPLAGRREYVRDLFLFSCFTGLAYADLRSLRRADIERSGDTGWLMKPREKNGRMAVVRLMPPAVAMLDRPVWRTDGSDALAVPDNRTCNRHLRVIGLRLGLAQPLHFHLARHTFATLLLAAGCPIETVSLMLGHSRITTTQIYAEVTRGKIARDTDGLVHAFM